jgi:hypothetical protein
VIGGDEVIDQVLIGGRRLVSRAGGRLEGIRRRGVIAWSAHVILPFERLKHDDFGLVVPPSPAAVMLREGGASSNHGERSCLLDRGR